MIVFNAVSGFYTAPPMALTPARIRADPPWDALPEIPAGPWKFSPDNGGNH